MLDEIKFGPALETPEQKKDAVDLWEKPEKKTMERDPYSYAIHIDGDGALLLHSGGSSKLLAFQLDSSNPQINPFWWSNEGASTSQRLRAIIRRKKEPNSPVRLCLESDGEMVIATKDISAQGITCYAVALDEVASEKTGIVTCFTVLAVSYCNKDVQVSRLLVSNDDSFLLVCKALCNSEKTGR